MDETRILETEVEAKIADLKDRRTFVGSSDAPKILGLWGSRYDLWMEKTGQREPDDLSDVERVQWGIVLEAVIAEEYARRTGKKVRRMNERQRHKAKPWMVAQIDRRIVGGGILEIKTTDAMLAADWGPEGTAEIPPKYYAQVQHQMAVLGENFAEVAVLIGGNQMRLYLVPRDEEFVADMMAAEEAFWDLVQSRTPPDPLTADEARAMWRKAPDNPVPGNLIHGAIAAEMLAVKAQIKEAEKRLDDLELELEKAIGERGDSLVVEGTPIVSWKAQTRTGIDTKRLKAEFPQAAAACETETSYRVFRVLKAAENFKSGW